MSSTRFPVSHSILDQDALAEWLTARYVLEGPVRCRLFRTSMSDAYVVETPGETYYLKVPLHNRHSRVEIEAEILFTKDLRAEGISVAEPVQRGDGGTVSEIGAPEGTRYAVLYRAAGRKEPRETCLEDSRQFGRLAASIHACADRLGKRYCRWHLDEAYLVRDPIRYMEPYLQHRPVDLGYLWRTGEDLIVELQGLLPKALPEYGICHGDLHTGNARLDRNGALILFDLDSCGYGWRALDVGVYRVSYDWMDLSRDGKIERDRFWGVFLEGYSEVRTLGAHELAAVALAMPIRHLELMGLSIRYWSSHQGIHWITDEYFDRHIDWFKRWVAEYRHF